MSVWKKVSVWNEGPRIDTDAWFLNIAKVVAMRSTCIRKAVGCIFVSYDRRIISTGFNGVPPGFPHCNEKAENECSGARSEPPGSGYVGCLSNHAEENAILNCRDLPSLHSVYCTWSPCKSCVKKLLGTNARRIVFAERHNDTDDEPKRLWTTPVRRSFAGYSLLEEIVPREWVHLA